MPSTILFRISAETETGHEDGPPENWHPVFFVRDV